MLRRTLLFALSLAALQGLSACKKPGDRGGSGGGPTPGSSTVVVGHYGSMTGNTAHFGQDTDKAIRLAVDEINAAGGLLGRQIRVVTRRSGRLGGGGQRGEP